MASVYKITRLTKALITKDSNYYQTRIFDMEKNQYSIQKSEHILAESCLAYGAGIEGRRKAVENILQTRINLPIPVIPHKGVFMFPTTSLTNKHCVLLSYYHIAFFEQRDHKVFVRFHDGTGLYINVSLHTFNMQFKKTGQVIAAYQRAAIWDESMFPSIEKYTD